jgi:hypothetical protein
VYILGVDLGQAHDYTALSVLDLKSPTDYHVPHLERLELGTPYPKQVDRIAELHGRLKQMAETKLIVDGTGVGRPIVDSLIARGLTFTAIQITGGSKVSHDGLYTKIPKRDLVAGVAVLLQNKSLKIAESLPLANTLVKELLGFKVSFNARGHDSYSNDTLSWREAPHDDLVLSVALACWLAQKVSKPKQVHHSTIRGGNWQSASLHRPRNPKEGR